MQAPQLILVINFRDNLFTVNLSAATSGISVMAKQRAAKLLIIPTDLEENLQQSLLLPTIKVQRQAQQKSLMSDR